LRPEKTEKHTTQSESLLKMAETQVSNAPPYCLMSYFKGANDMTVTVVIKQQLNAMNVSNQSTRYTNPSEQY